MSGDNRDELEEAIHIIENTGCHHVQGALDKIEASGVDWRKIDPDALKDIAVGIKFAPPDSEARQPIQRERE